MNQVILFCFLALAIMSGPPARAAEGFSLGPDNTLITGSIAYAVLGKYKAHFKVFHGNVSLEKSSGQVQSVDVEIQAASIKSNCPNCDRAARSRRLLNTIRYPKIIFKSDKIWKVVGQYKVLGVLEMHGVRKRIGFPFTVKVYEDPERHLRSIDLKGQWRLNRKDFNIKWNRYLDHGGVLVGDTFTVDWWIRLKA